MKHRPLPHLTTGYQRPGISRLGILLGLCAILLASGTDGFAQTTGTLTFAADEISEDAGNNATTATYTVSGFVGPATVYLESSNPGEATVPDLVSLPSGQASVTFPVHAVSDAYFDGNRTVSITASLGAFGGTVTEDITVLDDGVVGGITADNWADAIEIEHWNSDVGANNIGATDEIGEYDDGYSWASVWWRWQAPVSGEVTIHTGGSDFDTVLHVFASAGSLAGIVPLAGNDDAASDTLLSEVTFFAIAGNTYDIRVTGYDGEMGNIILTLGDSHLPPPPANDDWQDATELLSDSEVISGNNSRATTEPGEPLRHIGFPVYSSLWWKWTASTNGTVTVSLTGPGNPFWDAFEDAPTIGGLTLAATGRTPSFSVVQGTTYLIRVGTLGGTDGPFTLDFDFTAAGPSLILDGFTDGSNANFTVAPGGSSTRTFTVRNNGGVTLTGLVVSLDGAQVAEFGAGLLGATTLASGETTTFEIAFQPAAYGLRLAGLHVTSNETGSGSFDVALHGSGGFPDIVVEDADGTELSHGISVIDFGSLPAHERFPVPYFDPTTTRTVTVRNSAVGALFLNWGISDRNALAREDQDFRRDSPASPPPLGPGESTTLRIRFPEPVLSPGESMAGTGTSTANWQIRSNDADEGTFEIGLTGHTHRNPPANDHWSNATVIDAPAALIHAWNAYATEENDERDLMIYEDSEVYSIYSHTVWWRWTAPEDGTLLVDTLGSDFLTALHVYRSGDSLSQLTLLAANERYDYDSNDLTSQVVVPVVAGTTYDIRVSGNWDSMGRIVLNVNGENPRQQPNDHWADATVLSGSQVHATGSTEWATSEQGEPDLEIIPYGNGIATIWWRWQAPAHGTLTVDTETAGAGGPLLHVYRTGVDLAGLSLVASDTLPEFSPPRAHVSLHVEANQFYDIRVATGDGWGRSPVDLDLLFEAEGGAPSLTVTGNGQAITSGDSTPDVADDTDFGSVYVGAPRDHVFVLENQGDGTLFFSGPGAALSGSTDFALTTTLPDHLPPGASVDLGIRYQPSALGADSASVQIQSNAGAFSFVLAGEGIPAEFHVLPGTADGTPGSLRQAILDAATIEGNEVTVRVSEGTYPLTLGEALRITRGDLVILGQGATPADTVIDAGGNSRVLEILAGAEVRIENVTITGGQAADGVNDGEAGGKGGGIYSEGTLSVRHSVITGNQAGHGADDAAGGVGGGIYSQGPTFVMVNSVVSDNRAGNGGANGAGANGGGLHFRTGAVTITDSTFFGNRAGNGGTFQRGGGGGGIATNSDELYIGHCTFVDNAAGDGGAGIGTTGGSGGVGGGVFSTGIFTMVNSTLNGNVAGDGGRGLSGAPGGVGGHGGGIENYGTATLIHCTLTENVAGLGGSPGEGGTLRAADGRGGGLRLGFGQDVLNLENTIIAGNANASEADDNLYNAGGGTVNETGVNFLSGDPMLGPLADNGGTTPTMAPLFDSPVIDAAVTTPASPGFDQRGKSRSYNGAPDIGAVELQQIIRPAVVSNPTILETTSTGGRIGASVTDDSDGTITERGVVLGPDADPTIDNGTSTPAGSAGAGTFEVELTGLEAGTVYFVRAYAINETGVSYSSQSIVLTTVLPAPDLLAPTDLHPNGFTVNWNPVDGAESYRLDIATTPDFSRIVPGFGTLDLGDVTSYSVSGLAYGIPYHVRLRAYRGSVFSAFSQPALTVEPQLDGQSPDGAEFIGLASGSFRNFEAIPRQRTRFESAAAIDHLRAEGTFSSTLGSSRRYGGTWTYLRTGPDTGVFALAFDRDGTLRHEEYAMTFLNHERVQGTLRSFENGALVETTSFEDFLAGRPTEVSPTLPGEVQVGQPVSLGIGSPLIIGDATVVSVRDLPSGLRYDPASNTISGQARRSGSYELRVQVRNADGSLEWLTLPLEVNPLPESATGTFFAQIERNESTNDGLGGMLKARVLSNGLCSGYVKLGARRHSFRGRVSVDENGPEIRISTAVARRGRSPLYIEWTFGEDQAITGHIADADASTNLSGWRQTWHSRKNAVPEELQGNYNALTMLDPDQALIGDPAVPQGNGFAILRVRSNGSLRWIGKLADGTPLSFSGSLGPNAEYFLWSSIYRNKGSVLGHGMIETDADGPLLDNSIWTWLKNPDLRRGARKYPAGFGLADQPVRLLLAGDLYSPTGRDELLPGFSPGPDNAFLAFAEGGLGQASIDPGIRFELRHSGRGLVPDRGSAENPGRTQVSVSRRTGLIRGSFNLIEMDTATGTLMRRPARFFGIYLPNREQGAGFFLLNQLPDSNAIPPTSLRTSPVLSGQVGLAPAAP